MQEGGEDRPAKRRANYTLDPETFAMLRAIEESRRGSRVYPKSRKTRSGIVGSAIALLYRYEVLGESLKNPRDRI